MVKTDAAVAAIVPSVSAFLRDWIDAQRLASGVPGVQVAVRLRDRVLFSHASGVADTATQEPLTTEHAFRIASHSKTFTAVLIMQLVERGELTLDTRVEAVVPELRGAAVGSRTVRELLGHQGGVERDGKDANWWQRLTSFPDRTQLLAELQSEAVYPANTHFHYSNLAYSLLGVIIENFTGREFREVAAELAEPLSEYTTPIIGPDLGWGTNGTIVSGHGIPRGEQVATSDERVAPVVPPVDTVAQAAATGFWANAETISAWVSAHALGTGLFLTDESKRLMQRKESTITKAGLTRTYGLGWIGRTIGKRSVFGHSGGFPGHITQTWGDASTGLSVSVLTNRIDGRAGEWATAIIRLLDFAVEEGKKAESAEEFDGGGTYWALWGDTSLITLPGVIINTSLSAPDPAAAATLLHEHRGQWRADAEDSFGDAGETLGVTRDDNGVASITVTGITSWRADLFDAKRAEMLRP